MCDRRFTFHFAEVYYIFPLQMSETPQAQEDDGTPLTDPSHAENHADAGTQMDDHGSTPTHDNHLGMPLL